MLTSRVKPSGNVVSRSTTKREPFASNRNNRTSRHSQGSAHLARPNIGYEGLPMQKRESKAEQYFDMANQMVKPMGLRHRFYHVMNKSSCYAYVPCSAVGTAAVYRGLGAERVGWRLHWGWVADTVHHFNVVSVGTGSRLSQCWGCASSEVSQGLK